MKRKLGLSIGLLMMVSCLFLSACSHEHEFGEWKEIKTASCTEDGEEERKCNKCDEVETQVINTKGHQFGEWIETAAATCEEAGIRERVCSVCEYKEEETIEPLGHSFDSATLFLPKTCKFCGLTEGEALASSITVGEEVDSDDHSFVVEDIYFSNKISESRGNSTTTFGHEGNYCIFKISFTNKSTESLENYSDRVSDIELHYSGKYDYTGNFRLLIADEIVPLGTENLFIYYEVPELMKDDKENELYASFKVDGKTYAIMLNEGSETAKEETEENAEVVEVEKTINVGDTRTDQKGFSFVLTDIYYSTKVSETRGKLTSTFGTESNYLILKLDFTNLLKDSLENNSDRISNISLVYDDKYEYEGNYRIIIADEIVPLANENLFIFFDVPKNLDSMEGPLVATFSVDGVDFEINCR